MKRTILPRVGQRGLFRKVAFTVVNPDHDSELAEKITGGGPIPQLVMFRKTTQGWMRTKLIGSQSVEAVEDFINEGLASNEAEKKADRHGIKNRRRQTKRPPAKPKPTWATIRPATAKRRFRNNGSSTPGAVSLRQLRLRRYDVIRNSGRQGPCVRPSAAQPTHRRVAMLRSSMLCRDKNPCISRLAISGLTKAIAPAFFALSAHPSVPMS